MLATACDFARQPVMLGTRLRARRAIIIVIIGIIVIIIISLVIAVIIIAINLVKVIIITIIVIIVMALVRFCGLSCPSFLGLLLSRSMQHG